MWCARVFFLNLQIVISCVRINTKFVVSEICCNFVGFDGTHYIFLLLRVYGLVIV